jgi:hypothetical protein
VSGGCDQWASAEVVVHQPAGDAGRVRDVLDRDPVVVALGEQGVAGVEDLVSLPTSERADEHSDPLQLCGRVAA